MLRLRLDEGEGAIAALLDGGDGTGLVELGRRESLSSVAFVLLRGGKETKGGVRARAWGTTGD